MDFVSLAFHFVSRGFHVGFCDAILAIPCGEDFQRLYHVRSYFCDYDFNRRIRRPALQAAFANHGVGGVDISDIVSCIHGIFCQIVENFGDIVQRTLDISPSICEVSHFSFCLINI